MSGNDDENINLKINLDDGDFAAKIDVAKESLNKLGDPEGLKGAVDGLEAMKGTLGELAEGGSLSTITNAFLEFGPLLAAAGVALFAFKQGFDMTLEGEQIEAVGRQFDILTSNAGLAGEQLKMSFLASTDGLLSETDALKLANTAIVKLGDAASRLPEIMELSRKASLVMGTDLETTFNNVTRAIMTGNARALQSIGLKIDLASVERKYAEAAGHTVGTLSAAGKTQAILNAVLEEGAKKFDGVNESMKPVTTLWTQLKTAISDVGETVSVIFEKALGPSFEGWISLVSRAAKATKNFFVENFGDGADAAALKVEKLDGKMRDLASEIVQIQKTMDDRASGKNVSFWDKLLGTDNSGAALQSTISKMKVQYEQLRAERNALVEKEEAAKPKAGASAVVQSDKFDKQKLLDQQAEFEKTKASLLKTAASQEMALAQTVTQLKAAETAKKYEMEQKLYADIAEVHKKFGATSDQSAKLVSELQKNYARDVELFEDESLKRREAMWDNFAKHSHGAVEGFSRGAITSSKKASDELVNGAKLGEQAYASLAGGVGNAFQEMGKGAAGGSANIEHAVLGALGSIAGQYGAVMMLASIWPFNPPVFAAGAALEVLAGILGQVGSGSSTAAVSASSASSAASTAGASSSSLSANTTAASPASAVSASPAKTVQINVQGSIFDSHATGIRMVDLIRQASDNTDYAYVQVGNKPYGT